MKTLSYEERLARQVLDGEGDTVRAALMLFERRDPTSLAQAVELVAAHGALSPTAFDRVRHAYDIHRHARELPCD